MKPDAVKIEQVCKHFGSVRAVNNVSLAVAAGEFFSLLGPSGCGKTTLLRMIAGFEQPESGRIFVDGRDMSEVAPHKRPVNMVFQSYALFPHLTIFENIAFGLRCRRRQDKADISRQVKQALELVRLRDLAERYPAQISGGQAQRVALARAVVNEPAVLLLDEPLSALDLKIRRQMQDELARLQKATGITFVMVTHDQGEALALSDRVAVLSQGNLEQVGSPQEVYEQPASRFVLEFIGRTNLLEGEIIETKAPFLYVHVSGNLCLWVKNSDPAALAGRLAIVSIRTQALQLTDVPETIASSEPVNCFAARITQRSYQGSTTDYNLEVNETLFLKASCPNNGNPLFRPGQTIYVRLPAGQATILPATAGSAAGNRTPIQPG